jgi:hypothetical protein
LHLASFSSWRLTWKLKRRVGRNTGQDLDYDFWNTLTHYGAAVYAGTSALATYGTRLLMGNENIRVTGRLLVKSLSMSGVPAMVVRYLTG